MRKKKVNLSKKKSKSSSSGIVAPDIGDGCLGCFGCLGEISFGILIMAGIIYEMVRHFV